SPRQLISTGEPPLPTPAPSDRSFRRPDGDVRVAICIERSRKMGPENRLRFRYLPSFGAVLTGSPSVAGARDTLSRGLAVGRGAESPCTVSESKRADLQVLETNRHMGHQGSGTASAPSRRMLGVGEAVSGSGPTSGAVRSQGPFHQYERMATMKKVLAGVLSL